MSKHPVVEKVLEISGFKELNPPQKLALKSGLLEGKSMVLAAPTASGKTLAAEFAALKAIKDGKKVIYIVPLKALANEKYEDFKEKYERLGIKTAISTGDLDSSDYWLANYDIVILTSEKLDSLMRHGIPWIETVGLVVVDEIHLLNDPGRGPTLEVTITKLRQLVNPQFLGLSATISNYKELAKWLDAEAVWSDYRPVKLEKGIYYDKEVHFENKENLKSDELDPLKFLIDNSFSKGKQTLVFVSTRRSAEAQAEQLGKSLRQKLKPDDIKQLEDVSKKILGAVSQPTMQCRRLSECVKNGIAFHHAGAINKQKHLIEDNFKKGLIKAITSTPTLAAGINMPAYQVVIKDLKRFYSFKGMDYLPILEIEQMMGRSGRPKYDTEGIAILLAKSEQEAKFAWDNYINGEPEDISSKLGVEPILRMHILALIASGIVSTKKELLDFFFKTFYAHQYGSLEGIEKILDKVLDQLKNFNFITEGKEDKTEMFEKASDILERNNSDLRPTKIGKRVSELYIDPLTANQLLKSLEQIKKTGTNTFGYLHMISNTIEMRPFVTVRKKDYEILNSIVAENENFLTQKPPNEWDWQYDDYLKSIKTAYLFERWANETGEDKIMEELNVSPGELRGRLDTADWILYATQEIALLMGCMDILKDIRKTRLRIRYGVSKELLPLVRLKGVGRVRARKMFVAGIKSVREIKKIQQSSLEKIVGKKTASELKLQVE
ncbi:MAG: DEAD/DEAH box helicase [Candidatus Aenigmarchaeota archaeon]|nr:DEAD/DEAH box helicase [Candidatus Aenigmarchaeota archaeon]